MSPNATTGQNACEVVPFELLELWIPGVASLVASALRLCMEEAGYDFLPRNSGHTHTEAMDIEANGHAWWHSLKRALRSSKLT